MEMNDDSLPTLQSGMVDLAPLLSFLPPDETVAEMLDFSLECGKAYSRLCGLVTDAVPASIGFYVWGRFDDAGQWQSIYVGKADQRKVSSLRKRISEELREERCCFLADRIEREALMAHGERIFPAKWDSYRWNWERALLKRGTTHIAWVAMDVPKDQILSIEAQLIQHFEPRANLNRPIPRTDCSALADQLAAALKAVIANAGDSARQESDPD